MYSEIYPNLKATYNVDNFEQIAEAIDKNFVDLFQLNTLEHAVKNNNQSASYLHLFDSCMHKLNGLYTVDEIVQTLSIALQTSPIKEQLLTHFTFVPPIGEQVSKQVGFLEKLAVGKLKVAEPLTSLDIMRSINGLKALGKNTSKAFPNIAVLHLINSPQSFISSIINDHNYNVFIVNFNLDLKGIAKWGVVDLSINNNPRVYCETPLTEVEKRTLETNFDKSIDVYEGGKADGLISTGYTALAWLDTNITHAWNFDVSANFVTLLSDFMLVQCGGDAPGLSFTFSPNEKDMFCSSAFKHILNMDKSLGYVGFNNYYNDDAYDNNVTPGYILRVLCNISLLGEIDREVFQPGDLNQLSSIIYKNRLSMNNVRALRDKVIKIMPPGFGSTLAAYKESGVPLLRETDKVTTLVVPDNIYVDKLKDTHHKQCTKTNTNSRLLEHCLNSSSNQNSVCGVMMITTLILAKSKKPILELNVPVNLILSNEDKQFIINSLLDNAYVTEFKNVNRNQSLIVIEKEIVPTLARNRWLEACGYRPPMVDNYWRQAAKYWLIHLTQEDDLLKPQERHDFFKRCVLEMGLTGLDQLLTFLNDDNEREYIERIYGRLKHAFYAACVSSEYKTYLGKLLTHLQLQRFFPYSELGIAYQPGNDQQLILLLGEINKLEQFEQLTLTDTLNDKRACKSLLTTLLRAAEQQQWIGLIIIPELENKENASENMRELHNMYVLLNDVILRNRCLLVAQKVIKRIEDVSDFNMAAVDVAHNQVVLVPEPQNQIMGKDEFERALNNAIHLVEEDAQWPLHKGGVVQLQLQQQQQIEQNRQIQQEQQKVVINVVEEAISVELINYRNIDRILEPYFIEYTNDNKVNDKAATLRQQDESLLQGFFHTWINANPEVNASEIIQLMTPDAAKMLLRKHNRLSSGLNPDNLPKGFYTQQSKDSKLILCYNPEITYVRLPNAFTLNLDIRSPIAEAWEGDFRQFDLSAYIDAPVDLSDDAWAHIILFAQLQPSTSDIDEEYKDFLFNNPQLGGNFLFSSAIEKNKEKIIKFWPVFIQTWQYAGEKGVDEFIKRNASRLSFNTETAAGYLFKYLSGTLKNWVQVLELDEASLRAIGQIYYRYGDQGLTVFLNKLRQIHLTLGDSYFDTFNHNVLKESANYSCFISESFFTTMDDMMVKLKPIEAQSNLKAWQAIMIGHMQAVDWENIETLWKAFDYFISELNQLGLKLEGNEFDGLKSENMLIQMDRILTSLQAIPTLEMQQLFIKNCTKMDITNGGVHYALAHEKFKYFEQDLELFNFTYGAPTYAPDLKTLYKWPAEQTVLYMKRSLASQSQLSHQAYTTLSDRLGNADIASKHALMILLYTQYNALEINSILEDIQAMPSNFLTLVATHIHHAVFDKGNKQLSINLEAIKAFSQLNININMQHLLSKFPHGTLLEAISILHESNRLNVSNLQATLDLFSSSLGTNNSDYFEREAYKLVTLFGQSSIENLEQFNHVTSDLIPVVKNELRLLIQQLLSIDYTNSNLSALSSPLNWALFINAIKEMKQKPAQVAQPRIGLIEALNDNDLVFKYSKSGEFRALTTREQDAPLDLSFFVDHDDRLWKFLKEHVLVPVQGDAKEALQPVLRFLKKLQLNRTYLNEIEPLLSTLEKTTAGKYWSNSYFYQLLRALQPDNDQASFPISLLKVMLTEIAISAKDIDSVEKDFPQALAVSLQIILKNNVFERNEQALLCQLALREYSWQGNISLIDKIIATFSSDSYANTRRYALEILGKSSNYAELETQFENCCWLLKHAHPGTPNIAAHWSQTTALWLKALSASKHEEPIFISIKAKFADDLEKQALILHIIAYSCLRLGLKDTESYEYELDKKAPKLVERLGRLSTDELVKLADCYPQQPSPTADDILRFIKSKKTSLLDLEKGIEVFMRKPYPEPRMDFGDVASTRDTDLQRMILDTKISGENEKINLEAKHAARLTLIFSYLKQLESGGAPITTSGKIISAMNQQDLAQAFQKLSLDSAKHPEDDVIRTQIWAILFEVLGRTTRKYPHLAQQFALIANDVCMDVNTRVLQLATGEGKSHFVALRAARHAGVGKVVDVCTAKRTLAERDLDDYQGLFNYLGLSAAYIHPKSSRDTYMNCLIHYTTAGDLSLFLDEQSYSGQPIIVDKQRRVALFDEFDFIRFEEGRKTEYNYARPTGKTPKQMTWFYQSVNKFYTDNAETLIHSGHITVSDLKEFAHTLQEEAGENEERQYVIKDLLRDPLQLVQWLQSASEAHTLEWGVSFTVREENIEVGDESYPMREIIPLSSDNQKMVGSTFSAGVQQLLAVRLNTEAKSKSEAQNFHIHPESNIISSQIASQRMQELWQSWEGFSGTISAAQAATLNAEHGTQVLHVPTNQRDLRLWHKPAFYNDTNTRLESMIKQIRICLDKKQSILFSCKNDKHVNDLQQQLKKALTKQELASFIFYTNEEHKSASDVLQEKQRIEAWQGGKKHQAVGLVASGFGRGDNVGVEAVFLFDVNDTNDKLQKGGRTARNGAEGEVFQYYLNDELAQEEQSILQSLQGMANNQVEYVMNQLNQVSGSNPEEKRFERVMLLREYVFSLQNAANQGYHNAVAQFSSWGMDTLGKIDDPVLRNELTSNFGNELKKLDKQWIAISSNPLEAEDKIIAFERKLIDAAQLFTGRCQESLPEIKAFILAERMPINIKLVVPKPPAAVSKKMQVVASICSILTHLKDFNPMNKDVAQLPLQLEQLASNEKELYKFEKSIRHCKSTGEFENKLHIALDQLAMPSQAWRDVSDAASVQLASNKFLENVSNETRVRFETALNALRPALQESLIIVLSESSLLSAEQRIINALPLIEHLGEFTFEQQNLWAQDYIIQLNQLQQETPDAQVNQLRLGNSSPMSLDHYNAIWKIAKKITENQSQLSVVLATLSKSIHASQEQRLRLLTKWESWSAGLNKEDSRIFLMAFCRTMERFVEGENWDTFLSLVKKTQEWWNKGGESAYQADIIQFWKTLDSHNEELPALNKGIRWGMTLGGKAWFQILDSMITKLPSETFNTYLHQLEGLWVHLDEQHVKKTEKMTFINTTCDVLNTFNEIVKKVELDTRDGIQKTFLTLDSARFKRAIELIHEHKALMQTNPQLLIALLNYHADKSITSERFELLNNVLLRVAYYQEQHPELNFDYLLSGLDRFKDADEHVLKTLGTLIEYSRTRPLFDDAANYLAMQGKGISQSVKSVIELFYDLTDNETDPKKIMALPKASSLFAFDNNESVETRNKRICWMHAVKNNVFNTEGLSSEDNQNYKWGKSQNNELLSLGFNKYITDTQKVLDSKPKKKEKVRDLSVEQQFRILKLTEEMAIIGNKHPQAPFKSDSSEQVEQLENELDHLMNNYKSSWFKSNERTTQAEKLHDKISEILNNPSKYKSRYELVINAISQAKLEAIDSDHIQNENRWFKLNRSGQSRYYNTLNQMQDMVLRHWTRDVDALQGLQVYNAINKLDFYELTARLQEAVTQHYDNTYLHPDDERNKEVLRKINMFFTSKHNKPELKSLEESLKRYNSKVSVDGKLQQDNMTETDVNELIKEIRKDLPRLPGHLATLANEILARGDSLAMSLKDEASYDEIKTNLNKK